MKLKKQFEKSKRNSGWSYIETLIVIAIILILTATVGFMAINSLEKSKVAAAKTQIDSFSIALEAYFIDCGTYPTEEQGLSALRTKPVIEPVSAGWDGPYLYKDPPKDPWGNDYDYVLLNDGLNDFGIRSFGSDGKEGGEGKAKDICSWENE
jgi:general secretion pathway protein G